MQAELGKPSLLQPDKGKVSIYIDCSSTAEPAFEVAYSITFLASLFFFFFFFFFLFFFSGHSTLSTMIIDIDSKPNNLILKNFNYS